jgi:putative membrane protein
MSLHVLHHPAFIAVLIVAFLHVYFMILESFLWTKPAGMRAFGLTPETAASSRILAMNQGLYNGFLAAGLLWGAHGGGRAVTLFFLGFVIIAGVFGGITASRKILLVQALPGLIAFIMVYMA